MTTYKVVKTTDGIENGGISPGVALKDMELEYRKNRWTRPRIKDSGIFVFETLRDAKEYTKLQWDLAGRKGTFQVWKCQIKNAKSAPMKVFPRNRHIPLQWYIEFWNHPDRINFGMVFTDENVMIADEIKLIDLVFETS